jgi:hypothetical protein
MDNHFARFEDVSWAASSSLGYWEGIEKRLDGKDGKLETEANRMAEKMAENAGFGRVVAGQEDRWACGGQART